MTPRPNIPPGFQHYRPMSMRPPVQGRVGTPGSAMSIQSTHQMQQLQQIAQMQHLARMNSTRSPAQQLPNQMMYNTAVTPGSIGGPRMFIPPNRPPTQTPANNKRGIVISNSTIQRTGSARPNLLPPVNTYAHRLNRGYTSLVIPNNPNEKRKKSRFAEDDSIEDESDVSFTDSENESSSRRRSTRQTTNMASEQSIQSESVVEVVPPLFEMQKRSRLLNTTKHDFEKMFLLF